MSTKTLLKHARSLQQKKFRDLEGTFLVQGPKLVKELIDADWPVGPILATEEAAALFIGVPVVVVPSHELDRVGTLESGNSIIALARMASSSPVEDLGAEELVLALDGITDPGNMGTLLRIADWFGIRRIWCSTGSVEVYNPKCVQASMGAIFRVRVDHVDLSALLERQRMAGAALYLASMEGRPVFDLELRRKSVLVLGNESHGISAAVRALQGQLISIPGGGGAESLNVAMAASALCMEFTRQRRVL